MERRTRTTVTALTSAALLAGTMGAAIAVVDPAPHSGRAKTSGFAPGPGRPERAPLTAKATATGVRAWQEFRVYGSARDLRPGTRVALQQRQGKHWVTLPASMNTTRKATYRMRVHLGLQGRNTLRIVGGGRASAPFTVHVR
ncbi:MULTISPECIES: hypothetical protein [Streptomyces]|uniref:Uncharacterized protein n=2 Tax=Streptomyces TaxID=1883 RepID=A0A646KB84_STRJU|nr:MULTISPECIES: hypothetical protein [Streptomyces]MQS36299.1 hypothetical protein [Streptomyces katsurahamanus]MQS99443.1 hypothetical protein [Streptomyces jumonjinensis]